MLTIDDIPLLIEDAPAELHDWQARFQSLDDLRQFGCLPPALQSERNGSRNQQKSGVGLPLPNYSLPHGARLSTLYWPTGAARWAFGFFLADGTRKNQIMARAQNGGNTRAVRLQIGDEDHSTMFVDLWALPPHPVSAYDAGSQSERLWVIPLVDERYWWQFVDLDDFAVGKQTTWSALISQLSSRLGRSISVGAIDAAYLQPDPAELTRKFDNAALLLDAVAASVGCRVVFRFYNGVFELVLESTADAADTHTANLSRGLWQMVAGGKITDTGHEPETVVVTFPKWSWGVPWCNGDLWHADSAGDTSGPTPDNSVKVIHSSAYADFSGIYAGGTPKNASTLQALANAIKQDYYYWLRENYDYTYAGIKAWKPSGYDDYVEWSFGRQLGDGSRIAHTRIASQPHNFGVEQQLSQHPNWVVLDHFQIGKLKEHLVPKAEGGSGYADVYIWDTEAGAELPINFVVRAYEWPNWLRQWENDVVWLHWHCDENAWYVFPEPLEVIRFELDADKKLTDQFVDAYKLDPDLAKYGTKLQVWDTVGKWHGRKGYQGWAVRMRDSDHFEIIFLEGPARFIQFKLMGKLDTHEQYAKITYFWGAAPNHRDPSLGDSIIKVYDRGKLFKRALTDAVGFAVYDETDLDGAGPLGKYIVTQCNQMAILLEATLPKMCSGESAIAGVTGFQAITHAPFGQKPTSINILENVHGLANPAGSRATLQWNESRETWEVLQVKHRNKYVLISAGLRAYEGCKLRIEGEQLEIAAMYCDAPEEWHQDLQMTTTTVVDGVSIASTAGTGSGDPGTCALVVAKRTVCHLPHDTVTSQTSILLTPSQVLKDIYLDGTCLMGTIGVVFGFCTGSDDTVELECGTICVQPSGSG